MKHSDLLNVQCSASEPSAMPLSPTATRELLHQLEHLPNKKLGQNFLVDGNIVRKSIELAELDVNSAVVEIGPGLGTLTRAILASGASLWAVERDSTLAAHLRSNVVPGQPRLQLIEADCLDYPIAAIPSEQANAGYKIVANLPYAVSTPWMDAVLSGPLPQRMVLMLQKEAADRYVASHGSKTFGAISIFLQSAYSMHSRHLVSAQCFHPAPKVDSVLLRLDLKETAVHFPREIRECIRRIFTQRRKQLGSLCKKESIPGLSDWFAHLIAKGYSPNIRPEAITYQDWSELIKFQ
ncbi:16S rRNA (adenine(1518)-N(6)/adenine(1519)-N(6))-dimethyltransferase RsmA [Coraliomargarita sp. SDUM461004]|uniref:16S rRNA (Adenine(1518)-N(6)/adenine(1519)-N(6))-dimethyltransferase RsmA n=1 Tax=Thalassobacterium sedimentorum TaxID=3041258 RepID=A0ABU1AHI0_9BACT|nr:16S rRNA (adenine(1518)-N(6)/adenine(1519)-N(6))-dimethyltransferase RsmA [Coraliomargarita sp. SDUM461004]MDQ8193330.1 16S rRNA (adenine(1518)-N(6)/adenine(1519)-N(6))-dimethyltransferase RsmA [Coraliomargarita sp. SDUM461004]